MNNRIRELLPEPWTFPYPDREMYSREKMEHLAESILKEVCQKLENDGMVEIAIEMKDHFGVE